MALATTTGIGWHPPECSVPNAPFVTRFSRTNSVLNIGNLCAGNSFENCFRPTWQGYPTNLPSNVILYMQHEMPWSYIQNWHFTVQHSLTPNTLVDLAYVGIVE